MTIADGLTELKRIIKLLDVKSQNLKRYSSKQRASKDEVESQKEYVASELKAANDLITRYTNIKLAIQKSNLETLIEHAGVSFSIAEALLLKQGIFDMKNKVYESLTNQNAIRQLNEYNNRIQARALTQQEMESLNFVPELLYDELKNQKNKENLLDLRSYIDALIEKSNHQTFIQV